MKEDARNKRAAQGKLREFKNNDEDTVHSGCDYFTIYSSSCCVYGKLPHTSCQKTVDRPTRICSLYGKYSIEYLICVGYVLIIERLEL